MPANATYTVKGIEVQLPCLHGCTARLVPISDALALGISGGIHPSACTALQSGKLAPLKGSGFALHRTVGAWLLVAGERSFWIRARRERSTRSFFNFLLRLWQPLHLALTGPYACSTEHLYFAFRPEESCPSGPGLFAKLGFKTFCEGTDETEAVITYVETKTSQLRLTNTPGAGIFLFPVPECYRSFSRPGRAAEASLKALLLHNEELQVTPSGHLADTDTFSAALEYFFLEARGAHGVLDAMTRMLRQFSGDPTLVPRRCAALSAGGGTRSGRKRLKSWMPGDPLGTKATRVRRSLMFSSPAQTLRTRWHRRNVVT